MQCTSYFPGYYHPKDLNGGVTGNSWSIPHNNIAWNNGRGFYASLPPFTVDQNLELVHQKEIMKQMILKHEAIFRYQVNELHRVYWRQRELMDEFKRRKLVEGHLHLQALESKSFVSQLRPEISGKTHWPLVDLTSNEPSAPRGEMFQCSSNSITGQVVQPGADFFLGHNVTREWKASSSKSSASRKRMLDLELPAEEYVDNEEGEKFEEESPVQGHHILNSELQPRYSSKVDFVNPGDSSISNSSHRGTFLLFDLNEPIQPDETECPNPAVESVNIHEEISYRDQDLSGMAHAECSTLKKEVTGGDVSNLNSFDEVSSIESTLLPFSQIANSSPRAVDKSHDGTKTDKSLLVSPQRKFEIPIAVQALPCFSTNASVSKRPKSAVGNSDLTQKKIDFNLYNSSASSPTSGTSGSYVLKCGDSDHTSGQTDAVKLSKFSDSINSVKDMDLNFTPSSDLSDNQFPVPISNSERSVVLDCIPSPYSALESRKSTREPSVGPGNDSKLLTTNYDINFSCIKEETLSSGRSETTMTTVERDLEVPISPENKECSPPRGDSQDDLINTSAQWSKKDHTSDHTEEPDRAAAEVLLFISSSVVQGRSKTAMCEASEAPCDPLGWLADIATSLASKSQNEVGKLTNLRARNMDNYCHQLKTGKEKEAVCNTLHSRARSSRARSVNNHRVLQTEALPAAASVSLRQLNEDLLAIEGLKSHAKASPESHRLRKTPRRAILRTRRTISSLLQQHSSNDKQGISQKSWGVTKRRQKGRRARSCISTLCS